MSFAASPAYFAHIRSESWLRSPARLAELEASGGRCRLCDRGEPDARVQVHHRTYSRLGHERPADLTTLCVECHEVVTPHVRRVRRAYRLEKRRARVDVPTMEAKAPRRTRRSTNVR